MISEMFANLRTWGADSVEATVDVSALLLALAIVSKWNSWNFGSCGVLLGIAGKVGVSRIWNNQGQLVRTCHLPP